jgi:hypothetical protein
MGTLALSKSATVWALDVSEIALLVAGLLLVVGIIGEYSSTSEDLKKWRTAFEMIVVLAIAGELMADGGVFVFSRHLQAISDAELARVTLDVGNTRLAANKAADAALRVSILAEHAVVASGKANALAKSARLQVAALDEEAKNAQDRAVRLEREVAWRKLTPSDVNSICAALAPLAGTKIEIQSLSGDAEGSEYAEDFADVLGSRRCGWVVTGPTTVVVFGGRVPEGIFIKVRSENNPPASLLQKTLGLIGIAAPGEKDSNIPEGSITLFVGAKPRLLRAK